MDKKLVIWLVKDAEPLPLDPSQRLFRTGLLADTLVKQGHQVHWFASRFEHARKKSVVSPSPIKVNSNLTLHLLDGDGYTSNISLARIKHNKTIANHFTRITESLPKPNLIVTNYPSPELCLASSSFASLNKIPLYVDVRDPWPDSFAEYFPFWKQALVYPLVAYYRGVLSRSLKLATGIVSISNYMLDWAMQYSGRNKSQNDIVFYLGSKRPVAWSMPEFISSFSKENPLRLVFVGSFGKSYNIDLLIRAFRILSEQGEDRFTLDLIGDGELVANYKELASGLQGIKFHGWCNEEKMSLILKVCHIGLIPITGGVSKYWIGNKLFEYAGFGLAIINTTPNEAYEIVSKEDMGFNLRQNDPHILAKIIKNYLDNPNILKRHRENSLKLFDSSFDAEKIYADYVKHIIAPSESK